MGLTVTWQECIYWILWVHMEVDRQGGEKQANKWEHVESQQT